MSYQIWVGFIFVYQKSLKWMFKTGFWVQNHILNLCSSGYCKVKKLVWNVREMLASWYILDTLWISIFCPLKIYFFSISFFCVLIFGKSAFLSISRNIGEAREGYWLVYSGTSIHCSQWHCPSKSRQCFLSQTYILNLRRKRVKDNG